MSTARFGRKWADVDEDDEEEGINEGPKVSRPFETAVDAHGMKMVIEYKERDGKTYKVTKKVKQTTVTHWTNKSIVERRTMKKFGKPSQNEPAAEKALVVRSEEAINIELSRKNAAVIAVKDDAEDKFYEESISITESLTKEKKVWTDMNRQRQEERDGAGPAAADDKTADASKPAPAAGAPAAGDDKPGSKYVPPSLRNAAPGGKDGKGGGKGDFQQQQEASLRITNLSEDCREGDLQDLFGQYGRLQRVYLAKDPETFTSRGFAFITYYTREDAQKAIDKLHGHGYDNLIMQVMFAKPRV